MIISQKVQYGIACLNKLTENPNEFFNSDSLSHQLKIPPSYTHKILQRFSSTGLIDAQKGKGYRLNRLPSEISIIDIIDILSTVKSPARNTVSHESLIEFEIRQQLKNISIDRFLKRASIR
ncbi:hypothetical protein BVX98_01605 [bacterium F11]|nr:hypothetical protein BVX98_01605 [bacterium F11]